MQVSGSGPVLVLVHGLATTRRIWSPVRSLLAAEHAVVALDVPGFGASPPAGPGFELDAVAAGIAEALADAGVAEPYDVVGHSMGGAVALALAAVRPEAIARLVLVAPAGLRPMPAALARVAGMAFDGFVTLRRHAAPLAGAAWGRRLLLSPGTAAPAAITPRQARAMIAASSGATRTAAALATVACADLRPLVRDLPNPLGAVWGERDRVIAPSGLEIVSALRPLAPFAVVPGAGHIPMVEQPDAFVAALESVLGSLSRVGNTTSGEAS